MRLPLRLAVRPLVTGFTLIEILVVVSIIGILATVGLANFMPSLAKGRDAQRLDDARKIIAALEQYKADYGSYPVVAGWVDSSSAAADWIPGISPTYIERAPIDPKNLASKDLYYYYRSDGNDYCLQISQERPAITHRFFKVESNGSWKLRFGIAGGPNVGQCAL